MQRSGSGFMAALGMSVGLLTAQGIEAGEQAFIASDVVELVAREASTSSQALLPDRVSISGLEVLDEHDVAGSACGVACAPSSGCGTTRRSAPLT